MEHRVRATYGARHREVTGRGAGKSAGNIYVVNLRGDAMKSGDEFRLEGDKIFGAGSRNGVQITLLVRNPVRDLSIPARLHYAEVPERSSLAAKFTWLRELGDVTSEAFDEVPVDESHDWINQTDGSFGTLLPVCRLAKQSTGEEMFSTHALGVATNCDVYVYSFSRESLTDRVRRLIDAYEEARELYELGEPLETVTRNDFLSEIPMSDTPLQQDLPIGGATGDDRDNVTDWCLEQFHERYGPAVTKDDIWEYVHGVMHAPDWRDRYRHDLQRNLPRIPLADDFEAFWAAGRVLMDLHIGYETVPEWPLACLVDGEPDEGAGDPAAYRIDGRMRWGGKRGAEDRSVLLINERCRLVGIPDEAHHYTVSGRSPLEWAIDSLRLKVDRDSGITDDPNGWCAWADDPFELIRHLRRLVHVSVVTARTIAALPPSLPPEDDQEPRPD